MFYIQFLADSRRRNSVLFLDFPAFNLVGSDLQVEPEY